MELIDGGIAVMKLINLVSLSLFLPLFNLSVAVAEQGSSNLDILKQHEELSIFLSLVEKINAESQLQHEDGYITVFAPVNQAFERLDDDVRKKLFDATDLEFAEKTFQYHVVDGLVLTIGNEPRETDILTEEGHTLHVVTGGVTVNNARIIGFDLVSNDGVVHAIDQVLVPLD